MEKPEDIIAELDEIQEEIEGIETDMAGVQIEDRQEQEYFTDQYMRLNQLTDKIEELKENILGGEDGRKHRKEA